jgi:uncharacterized membrane protein required for colicin V production
MSLPAINTNIIVIGIIVATGLYGLIGGKQRLRLLILSVYVGIVLAQQFATIVTPMLHMLGPDPSCYLVSSVLFIRRIMRREPP